MDLAIADTTLLTMRDGPDVIEDGTLGIADGEIAYVGPASDFDPSGADRVLDGEGLVTMPGLVNAHAHTYLTLLRGAAQDVPEIEWMTTALGPIAAHMDDADRIAGARLGAVETLRSGATTLVEYAGRVGELVEEVYRPLGVRTVATETINEVGADRSELGPRELYPFDRSKGEAAFSRARDLVDGYGDDPLVTPMYGPQALDMVSPDLLASIREAANDDGVGIHMHVAQGERERLQVEERYGEATVPTLDDLGLLDDSLLAAHLHGATAAERGRLVDRGVSMVGCPSSIAAIDGIVPPIREYRDLGGAVGIGTDQAPGPGHHNAFREMRTASTLSKVDAGDPTALPAWDALEVATLGGARALGLGDRIGSLAEGKRADVVTVDLGEPNLAPVVSDPLRTLVPNLVYSTTGTEVRDVLVDGAFRLRDGAFVDLDPREVARTATERARGLFERAGEDWRAAGSELVDHADAGRL